MLLPTMVAALAAAVIPAVNAYNVTTSSTAVRCTTSFGYEPLSSGTTLTTFYNFATTTNIIRITSTVHSTVTATASASTLTGVVTDTVMVSTTITSTPPPTVVPTSAGFLPLFAFAPAGPTGGLSRVKRYEMEGRDAHDAFWLLKRQTAANNTGGLRVDRNGHTSNVYRRFPQQVNCRVSVTVNKTMATVEEGDPMTTYVDAQMATSMTTVTVSSTTTLTAVEPQKTVYAACQENNVVSSVEGTTGMQLIFDRVIYRPSEGFPVANELIVNTTSAQTCCIACQNTAFCAGSIYAPFESQCHLRLTQAPVPRAPTLPGNSSSTSLFNSTQHSMNSTYQSYPTYALLNSTSTSGLSPTGSWPSTPLSTSSSAANTCGSGSRSLYLGTVQGQTDFPIEYALALSNGPCGRFSVWPVPVNSSLDNSLSDAPMKKRAEIGM
ncbi:hypothetical protein BDU57DRAFT_557772 [Ampelomyces quisqualis]|uniref:Apple domain-containing protein n=1 Tax=Ampelomyces quisqualis TaxID=50730 RepID=A0A6A5QLB3_AMPQU|nr:hypothetical protein BDU57DRAFT_557772 [Ampelomyces quisqualis]